MKLCPLSGGRERRSIAKRNNNNNKTVLFWDKSGLTFIVIKKTTGASVIVDFFGTTIFGRLGREMKKSADFNFQSNEAYDGDSLCLVSSARRG